MLLQTRRLPALGRGALARTLVRTRALAAAVAGALLVTGSPLRAQGSDPNMVRALRVLRTSPVIDGHNDLPWAVRESRTAPRDVEAYDLSKRTVGRTDLARLRQGMVGGQFWSVYIPGEIRDSGFARVQLEQIDIAKRIIARYPDRLALALTAADVRRDFATGKIASLLGMEGGHAIENSLGALRSYYGLGVRYMTLTHNVTLNWADAALDQPKHGGLTPFGKEVVREMNRLGMLVDLSHVSPGTMSAALDVTEAPVIFSHSSARALVDSPRDVPDSILKRMPKNGGVVMVTFVPGFVSREYANWETARARADSGARQTAAGDTATYRAARSTWLTAHPQPAATLSQVADHVEHVRDVAGIDHVGLGGDFDGTGSEKIVGLEDVSTYPALFAELARRGWSDADMRKLADQNVLRALEQAESVAQRLQKIRQPSTRTIDELDRGARPAPEAR